MWVDNRGRGVFSREASERECWRGDRQGGLNCQISIIGSIKEREVDEMISL